MEPPAVETVMVAIDESDAARKAIDYAVAITEAYAADIVILHVMDRADYQAIQAGETDAATVSQATEDFLTGAAERAREAGRDVRTATAYGFSPKQKLRHPGSVVLDTAEEIDADFIVIPRESAADMASRETLTKAAEHTLLYASQPVLSV